ncbi:hypothetical protein PVAP13_3NG058790 [Panicum virgatum]|uniref:Uncharacterized protein n=1 Tax=Panicum virgatum TaxID=38727 RepID=A0A8T0TXB2_PANVG|nr:hypothetical protein PVAP13_3NG058790 [Panicum virgatum]KAG2615440.1 hypothetical protein PVAP13_3NG058790 [Panicum virgatum]
MIWVFRQLESCACSGKFMVELRWSAVSFIDTHKRQSANNALRRLKIYIEMCERRSFSPHMHATAGMQPLR